MIPKSIKDLSNYCEKTKKRVILGRTTYGTTVLKGITKNE